MSAPAGSTDVNSARDDTQNSQPPRQRGFQSEPTTAHNFPRMRFAAPIMFDAQATTSHKAPVAPREFSYYGVLTPSPAPQSRSPSYTTQNRNHDDDKVTDDDVGFKKSFPTSRHSSMTPIAPNTARNSLNSPHISQSSPVFINQTPRQLPLGNGSMGSKDMKLAGKLQQQYTIEGQVVNGKGLDQGRAGIKRGPQTSQPGSETSGDAENTVTVAQEDRSTPQAVSVKRKRTDSEVSQAKSVGTASTPLSKESTPEYNPASTQTRSGRQSQKPVPIMVPTPTNSSPVPKRQSTSGASSTPVIKKHPKIKAKVYRGREQFALCEHCLRGHGPSSNVIVFCDACNKCWHQNCHTPRITKEIVADSKAEWFCADCDRILHGKKKIKPATNQMKPNVASVNTNTVPQTKRFGPPLVGAASVTLAQRKEYLNTLSKERLIDLILRAGDLAPRLPMFETPVPPPAPVSVYNPPPQPQFASTYVTPVDKTPTVTAADIDDEGYDDSFDEHAALYPKPGEGIKLPPDSVDLHMLLEGPGSSTFSHWVRGMPVKTSL